MESTIEIRRTADRIEGGAEGGFRRNRRLERSPEGEALTLRAVRRAQVGDGDALRFLYLRYADNVYGYVCSIVRDEHDAEDVTQQIFAKLLTALDRYEPRVGAVLGVDPARRPQRRDRPHARAPADPVRRGPRREHEATRTSAASASPTCARRSTTLPAEQRKVMVLRFMVGLTPARGRRAARPLRGRRARASSTAAAGGCRRS